MENHFMEYDDLLHRIEEVRMKIIEIKEKIYSVSGVRYDDTPRGTSIPTGVLFYLSELEEYENNLEELRAKEKELRNNHEAEINLLPSAKHRSVLRMFYLMKLDVFKIADALGLSVSRVWALKSEAVKEFKSIVINRKQ